MEETEEQSQQIKLDTLLNQVAHWWDGQEQFICWSQNPNVLKSNVYITMNAQFPQKDKDTFVFLTFSSQ